MLKRHAVTATAVAAKQRYVTRPTHRKPRAVNYAHNSIPLAVGATENCLLHRHMGGYLLIELNGRDEPVRAWRDCDGIFPIRSGRVDATRIAQKVARIAPKLVYMNDGEPLRTLFGTASATFRVVPYGGSLVDQLSAMRAAAAAAAATAERLDGRRTDAAVSYREALRLDPTMTRTEYRKIFMTTA